MNDLSLTISEAVTLGNEVLHAFVAAPHVLSNPMFFARYALIAVEIAAAPDDETRRGISQVAVLALSREFLK